MGLGLRVMLALALLSLLEIKWKGREALQQKSHLSLASVRAKGTGGKENAQV